jgi:hypothetical protein
MLHSRLLTTVALLLVLGYALPVLCARLPAAGTTTQDAAPMRCGGCHGHHHSAPAPNHNCCASHPAAAALQASITVVPLNLVSYRSADEIANNSDRLIPISINPSEFSPPPPSVLRI